MKVKIKDIKVGERFRQDYGDIEELALSIQKYGLLHPIVVDRDLNLVAGERRLRAHILLGREEIEVKFLDELDELTRKEVEIEENLRRKAFTWQEEVRAKRDIDEIKRRLYGSRGSGQHTEEGWSLRDTAEALGQSLGTVSMDIQLARALDIYPELAKEKNKTAAYRKYKKLEERALLRELARRQAKAGHLPENVWQGDCIQVMREKLEDESVDLIITDPPFGINLDKDSRVASDYGVFEYTDVPSDILDMLGSAYREMYRVLRPNSHCYVFFGIVHYELHKQLLLKAGFALDPVPCIWYKMKGGLPTGGYTYMKSYEPFFLCWKGRRTLNGMHEDVMSYPRPSAKERIHVAQKPVALIQELIEQSSMPGDTVLDCFAGSGSVGVAAYRSRRKYILIEKDPATYTAMCERLAAMALEPAEGGDDNDDNADAN